MPDSPVPASASPDVPVVSSDQHVGMWPLRITVVAAALWYSTLLYLILTAANPVFLNQRQIAESDAVVQASVGVKGGVRVEHVWRGAVSEGPLDVSIPKEAPTPGDFIIPLRRTSTGWEVTPTAVRNGFRLVYPVSDEAVQQLEGLLAD